ncbi:MAG: hypothetical protein GY820_21820 [Gammaproteobacteria bacterium]|nr:hypothetical protein [Gammaproteobacteria bacterium]
MEQLSKGGSAHLVAVRTRTSADSIGGSCQATAVPAMYTLIRPSGG